VIAPVLQACVYVLSADRERVLLIRRDKIAGDLHYGKYLSLGGHVEAGEDPATAARREVREESGLVLDELVFRGTVMWTGFGPKRLDALCFMFRADTYTGTEHGGNEEGTLEWVPVEKLASVPMWESDHLWLPMIFDDDPRPFFGVMPYDGGTMLDWSYQR
jgi:8-oxo-dGTP diphosphatase